MPTLKDLGLKPKFLRAARKILANDFGTSPEDEEVFLECALRHATETEDRFWNNETDRLRDGVISMLAAYEREGWL